MQLKSIILIIFLAVVFLVIPVAVWLASSPSDTSLALNVTDAVSKGWVHDLTVKVQDKTINSFFTSDLIINGLKPGPVDISLEAPYYLPQKISMELSGGQNIADTIELTGFEIPDLNFFFLKYLGVKGDALAFELHPYHQIDEGKREQIENYPCLDVRILCLFSAQVYEGQLAMEATNEGSVRGDELFRGELAWHWDPDPANQYHYYTEIPLKIIKDHEAPFRVADFLIIVPDPRKIDRAGMDDIIRNIAGELTTVDEIEDITAALDKYNDVLFWNYAVPVWNIPK